MLNKDDAANAIEFFYRDVENLEIGNPQPFVMSYNVDTQIEFNELMFESAVKNIFYGTITYSMTTASTGVGTTLRAAVSYFKTLDGSVVIVPFDISRFFAGALANKNFIIGSVGGLFAQQLVIESEALVSFDGYIFSVTQKP